MITFGVVYAFLCITFLSSSLPHYNFAIAKITYSDPPHTKLGVLGHIYEGVIDTNSSYLFIYNFTVVNNVTQPLRLSLLSRNSSSELPLLAVVRQSSAVQAFSLPLVMEKRSYWDMRRDICPASNYPTSSPPPLPYPQLLYIDLMTSNPNETNFQLIVDVPPVFNLRKKEPTILTASPTKPVFLLYKFDDDTDTVVVTVTSSSKFCAIVSVQKDECPISDLPSTVRYAGTYQTMTTQAGITVSRIASSSSFQSGFHLVLMVLPDDLDCFGIETIYSGDNATFPRNKTFSVLLHDVPTGNSYYLGILSVLAVFFVFFTLVWSLFCGFSRICYPLKRIEEENGSSPTSVVGASYTEASGIVPMRREEGCINNEQASSNGACNPSASARHRADSDSSLESNNHWSERFFNYTEDARDIARVGELSKKGNSYNKKKSTQFFWGLLIVCVFYGLPVVQLVFNFLKSLNSSGMLDMCYYNFRCLRPWSLFYNFNNIFSNCGYVFLGILFILVVKERQRFQMKMAKRITGFNRLYGIPQHFGMFYSLGVALLMEGCLSASYHVCPSSTNFQFDTSFMFIMGVLMIIKLYQGRHADISPNSTKTFLILALIVFYVVVGVVFGGIGVWIVFTIFYMVFSLLIATKMYYLGFWRLGDYRLFLHFGNRLREKGIRCLRLPCDMRLFVIPFVLGNWTLALYGVVMMPADFATYLLSIILGNFLFYLIFYFIMKFRFREPVGILTIFFLLIAVAFWGGALYFFLRNVTSWQLTPAESRELNRMCILFDFYDSHDVWHFLSAFGIFFSFMSLLTIDDGVMFWKRNNLRIF